MKRSVWSVIVLLALFQALLDTRPVRAVTLNPKLLLNCTSPQALLVTCTLTGIAFRPRERVALAYRIEFTGLPQVAGKYASTTFHRTATTDAIGTFIRVPFRFLVLAKHESYRLTATAVGDQGDQATITINAVIN